MQNGAHQESIVRSARAEEFPGRYLVGQFPLGAPELRPGQGPWGLQKLNDVPQNSRQRRAERDSAHQQPPAWLLEAGPGQPGFKGQAAGGLQGRGSQCYFLFMRQGADLVAVPVDDWYTFKPVGRGGGQRAITSTEEAEAAMQRQNEALSNAAPRLANVAATAPEEMDGFDDEDDGEVDAEEAELRARRARAGPAAAGPIGSTSAQASTRRPVHGAAGSKGEDWDHEAEAADDDMDMGGDVGSDGEPAPPSPTAAMAPEGLRPEDSPSASPTGSDSEGTAARQQQPHQPQPRSVQQLLKRSAQPGSPGLDDEDDDDDEDEDDYDSDDLDEIYSNKAGAALSTSAASAGQPAIKQEGTGRGAKRKLTPEPSPGPASQRVKTEDIKEEGTGHIKPQDMRQAIISYFRKNRTRVIMTDFVRDFKPRLPDAESKASFSLNSKQLITSKEENGVKLLELK
ncbi:hypothetical protein WJX74_010090 [Apatococcus lobatus]|uniref:Transcription initiation factor IIF subunit alpha n=1 Tax=Apatococcus lobatus TaxID=904363 RepID=A0AAW1S2X9_9CHLO